MVDTQIKMIYDFRIKGYILKDLTNNTSLTSKMVNDLMIKGDYINSFYNSKHSKDTTRFDKCKIRNENTSQYDKKNEGNFTLRQLAASGTPSAPDIRNNNTNDSKLSTINNTLILLIPYFSKNDARHGGGFIPGESSDGLYRYKVRHDSILTEFIPDDKTDLHQIKSIFVYDFFRRFDFWFYFTVLLLLFALFFIIKRTINTVFHLGLFKNNLLEKTHSPSDPSLLGKTHSPSDPSLLGAPPLDPSPLEHNIYFISKLKALINNPESPSKIFIVGMPWMEKLQTDNDDFITFETYYELDGTDTNSLLKEIKKLSVNAKGKKLIIDCFDYKIDNIEMANQKIKILEFLSYNIQWDKVIIISSLHYDHLLDHFRIALAKDQDLNKKTITFDTERLTLLMADYIKIYSPIEKTKLKENKDKLQDLIDSECGFKGHLEKIGNVLRTKYSKLTISESKNFIDARENIILEVQSMSQTYYQTLWNSCSKEERLILYDLAEDNLCNPNNYEYIRRLYSKGLVRYDEKTGKIHLLNRSFQNFILTIIKPEDALQIEKEINPVNFWDTIKYPLYSTLIAGLILAFYTESSLFTQFIALVTGMATLLTNLPRLVPNFPFVKAKTS